MMKKLKKFKKGDIRSLGDGTYWFECSMINTCSPAFDNCEDNHKVEEKLRENGVIFPTSETDTESCALVVNFKTRNEGYAFLSRLNHFLSGK